LKNNKVKRYVSAADVHFPHVDYPTWNALMAFISDPAVALSGFIFQGDQFDNAEISHHNKSKPYYKEKASYKKNQTDFLLKILHPLEAALDTKGVKERVWIQGNHDDWEFQFIEEHPELEGMLDRRTALELDERGWEFIPLAHAKVIGDLNVIHGEILTGIGNQAGMYPARKAVELYGGNVLAAHTHAPQSYTKISPVEQKKKYMGWIAPIVGNVNPVYLKDRPTALLNGFTIIEVHPNGHFNLFPVIISEGEFAYGGKLYKGGK